MKNTILLFWALTVTVLWVVRAVITGSLEGYGFLLLNIFLAAVPLLLEPLFPIIKQKTKGVITKLALFAVAFSWLMFLPNAFYILTDFMHLNSGVLVNLPYDNYGTSLMYGRGDSLFVFDSLLIVAATIFGALAGGLALFHAYTYIKKKSGEWIAGLSISTIMLLAAIGVFIGRFGRWNSWEILYYHVFIVIDLFRQLMDPAIRERFIITIVTIFLFQALCLYCVHYIATRSKLLH